MWEKILKRLHDADREKTRRQLHLHKTFRSYLFRNLTIAAVLGVAAATAAVFVIEKNSVFILQGEVANGSTWGISSGPYATMSDNFWKKVRYERYLYQEGGKYYDEFPGQKTENAWVNRILGVFPLSPGKTDDNYFALYDFNEEKILADNSMGEMYVVLRFEEPNVDGADRLGMINYKICPEQTNLFSYPEESILNPTPHVLSGYVKDGEIIIETYTDHLWETEEDRSIISLDLSNINTEGYDYICADDYPYFREISVEEASEQGYFGISKGYWYGEFENGKKYQIARTVFGGSGAPETIKQEALGKIPDYQTESGPSITYEKVHFFGRRYWYTERLQENGDDIGYVLTFEAMLPPTLIAGIFAIILLVTLGGAILISEIQYSKRKALHDVYEQRVILTNTLAHDLKTPLAVIRGYAENLEDSEDAAKKRKYASQIRERADGMNTLIENILELNRGDMITVTSRKIIDMKEEWLRAIREKDGCVKEKGLKVVTEGEGTMEWNPSYVSRVTDNLLDNAMKYASSGSEILIRIEDGEFSVENIFDEEIEAGADALCEPFVRGNSARTGAEGNGLGLAIVKQICETHDAELKIEIRENRFRVRVRAHRGRRKK